MSVKSQKHKPLVLVVDDDLLHCHFIRNTLKNNYHVVCAHRVHDARKFIASSTQQPDIILLDFNMPDGTGHNLLKTLKRKTATHDTPVILITANDDVTLQEKSLEHGAVDFLTKPVAPGVLCRKVNHHINIHRRNAALHGHNLILSDELEESIRELQMVQDVTILALASLTEVRDNETGEHIWRTQEYVRVLASALLKDPLYGPELSERDVELICKSAPLHDIGKVGIPDNILNKPAPLTTEEFEIIKGHTLIGYNAIAQAEKLYENRDNSFLRYAREICCHHHEKWNGSGYPHGLSGEDIPLSARIMAIADIYDALISKRPYKKSLSHEESVQIIMREKGKSLDPHLTDLFYELNLEFKAIAQTGSRRKHKKKNEQLSLQDEFIAHFRTQAWRRLTLPSNLHYVG